MPFSISSSARKKSEGLFFSSSSFIYLFLSLPLYFPLPLPPPLPLSHLSLSFSSLSISSSLFLCAFPDSTHFSINLPASSSWACLIYFHLALLPPPTPFTLCPLTPLLPSHPHMLQLVFSVRQLNAVSLLQHFVLGCIPFRINSVSSA